MKILEGRLVGAKKGYAGHIVEALFSSAPSGDAPTPPKKKGRGARTVGTASPVGGVARAGELAPIFHLADVADDGRFLIDFGDDVPTGGVDLVVRAPSGERLAEVELAADKPLEVSVKPARPFEIAAIAGPVASALAPVVMRVTVLRKSDRGVAAGVLVSVWENGGSDTAPPTVVGAAYADSEGRARIQLPRRRFAGLTIEVAGDQSGKRHRVPTDDAGHPVASLRIEADIAAPDANEGKDACDCEAEAPPRAPDHEDLVGVDGVYASDRGGGCVKLTTPNRTIEEYNFTMLVRTTDPVLWGVKPRPRSPLSQGALDLIAKIAFGASSIDAALKAKAGSGATRVRSRRLDTGANENAAGAESEEEDIRLSSEAYRNSGLLAARAWRDTTDLDAAHKAILKSASGFSEDVLRQALSDPDGFTPTALMTAERKYSFEAVRQKLATSIFGYSQRAPISASNAPEWEGNGNIYQAATIAHGHVLGFRQIWKADGYSLGDLLYSLPLGPGQKRKIVVLDWDRREAARRDESRTATEAFSADLSRDRDVAEIVNSTITESIRAESNARSWGAGGGIGLGIPIGAVGFLGIGVAGGGGGASSDAQQNSARAVAASSGQHLSDRTQQAAAAVRSQRGTIVASRTQHESVSVTSEVVANYNHCHAITIEYFEVLKHYRVDQDIVSVRECLFVPLHISPFDDLKALRWRDTLDGFVFDRSLRPAFASVARLVNGYADSDFPPGRYADEVVNEIWGDFGLELNIARPRPPAVDEVIEDYLANAWAFYDVLFGPGAAAQAFKTYIAGQDLADQVFADELAPRIARTMVDNLTLKLVLQVGGGTLTTQVSTDFTMVSSYRPGREHLVSFKIRNLPPGVTRAMIRGIRIETATDLSPNSQSIVRSVRCSYRNAYRSFAMVSPRRTRDELRPGDQFYTSTRSLSRAEEFNPRANDIVQRDALIKHLNEHVEHYHRLMWWRMDPGRRFMLLDGFIAPNSGGRSVASVTENRLLDVIGNCLVLPVAPGYQLNPMLKPPAGSDKSIDLLEHYRPPIPVPPRRISVPTRGVHAEAIMGDCNSCEKHTDTRFWDWASEPTGDEPTDIGETSLDSRRQAPLETKPTDFPAPIVAIQNAPAAPDPTGLGPFAALLGTSGLFTDITGLEGNQKNALAAFQGAMRTANAFGKLAAAGAKTIHAQGNSERIMKKATEAHKKKQLNDKDAKTVVGATVGAVNGDQGKPKEKLTDDPTVKKGIDAVANGSGKRSMQISSDTGSTSQSVDVQFDGDAGATPAIDVKVDGIVPAVAQIKSKGCWAAALTMIASWKRQQSFSIETLLGEAGGDYLTKYQTDVGLKPTEVGQMMTDFGLRDASVALTAKALADQLSARGPLWVVVDEDNSAAFSVHALVVTGVRGDGTPKGTMVQYNDPADGSLQSERLNVFVSKMEQLAAGIASAFGGPTLQILSN